VLISARISQTLSLSGPRHSAIFDATYTLTVFASFCYLSC